MARCYRHSHGPHMHMQGACNANVYGSVFETRLSFYINTAIDEYKYKWQGFPISLSVNLYREHHVLHAVQVFGIWF